jgi:hypothetical protein
MSPVTPAEDARSIMINNISWGAVLAGVVVGLVTQLILNMIGIGVGAATLDPGSGDNPQASTFSLGAAIWFGVASILAALIGGFVASRLSGRPKESTGGWHGLTAWAVTTLVIFYLLTTTIGSLIGGAYQSVTGLVGNVANAAGGAAQTAAEAAPEGADPMAAIEEAIRGATGGADPGALMDGAVASVRAALTGDPAQSQEAVETAAQSLAEAQGIPIEEARTQVQEYQQQYQETAQNVQETVTETADAATEVVSRGVLYSALGLILSGIAAYIGGRMGTVDPTITARVGRRV